MVIRAAGLRTTLTIGCADADSVARFRAVGPGRRVVATDGSGWVQLATPTGDRV